MFQAFALHAMRIWQTNKKQSQLKKEFLWTYINPLQPGVAFLYLLKKSENLMGFTSWKDQKT